MAIDPSLKLLVVDDDEDVMLAVLGLLRRLGLTDVEEAGGGAEALEKLRQGHFDAVLSDWNMEPVSGIELLREVRADARLTRLPFVLMTAESTSEKIAAAQAAGASAYLVKPFDENALRDRLMEALAA